ncbi:MAG: hypothetical protein K8M05_32020 [Deltaproteobacteria bacterium]|nr:hypothetical protein [Kofleriaceae bacterium]
MRTACRSVLVAALLAACGGGGNDGPDATPDAPTDAPTDAAIPPAFRNPVSLPDLELAQMAATLLGEGSGKMCDACHGLTRTYLRSWDAMTDAGESACLTDLAPTTPAAAMTIVNCLRDESDNLWHPGKIGIHATAAGLPWFEYVFRLAHGDAWQAPFDEWTDRVWMPRGGRTPYTQAEFDIVAEWFARDLPNLDDVIASDPVPPPCDTTIGPEIATHVAAMETQGWRQVNEDAGINMFGCQGAATTRDCLSTFPLSTANTWSQGWTAAAPAQKIRILRELDYGTNFWTRSSADGRFVAHGGNASGNGSTVIDLQRGVEIPANALYDPGFFPDNSGFILQGGGGQFCLQSLLTGNPSSISFNEPECTTLAQVGLYQHLGRVNGGDFFTVHGQFTSDNGGHNVTGGDPATSFSSSARNTFTPMIHDGNDYVAKPQIEVSTPYEGDMEMSQSARLVIARTGTQGGSGFIVRHVTYTPNGAGGYIIDAPIVARYCVRGGKPGWSYDERWLTYHHYVGANDWQELGYASATDPAFVALRQQGAANTYVLDMLTGEARRVTTMGPGQYALYPHFRSDGWLYIQIRDRIRGREYVVASDVALIFESP